MALYFAVGVCLCHVMIDYKMQSHLDIKQFHPNELCLCELYALCALSFTTILDDTFGHLNSSNVLSAKLSALIFYNNLNFTKAELFQNFLNVEFNT